MSLAGAGSGEGAIAVSNKKDRAGIAYVSEMMDESDVGRMSGRFATQCEHEGRVVLGPQNVLLTEALEWAELRARTVLLQFGAGDGLFYIGDPPGQAIAKPWAESASSVAARPLGSPLDGRQQEVPWQVAVWIKGPRSQVDATRARVLADASIGGYEAPGGELVLTVNAGGMRAAFEQVDPLLENLRAPDVELQITVVGRG
jgi:hypothetical protein